MAPSTNLQAHENSFEELTKCSETAPGPRLNIKTVFPRYGYVLRHSMVNPLKTQRLIQLLWNWTEILQQNTLSDIEMAFWSNI